VIERIRLSAFLMLAAILGSVVWILAGAWGWHPDGWMLTKLGYHDVGAAGVVHGVAGFFALGVLMNLGARVGKYQNGQSMNIRPHNLPMALIGLMMIIVGFFGFLGGCMIFNGGETGWTTIYGNPSNLSAFAFNTLMGFSGGVLGAYMTSREPFWTMSGGLAGIISVAAGLDLYYPGLAFVLAASGGALMPMVARLLEKMGIDDPVGAVAVHGFCGVYSVVLAGIFASSYPNVGDLPEISLSGRLHPGLGYLLGDEESQRPAGAAPGGSAGPGSGGNPCQALPGIPASPCDCGKHSGTGTGKTAGLI